MTAIWPLLPNEYTEAPHYTQTQQSPLSPQQTGAVCLSVCPSGFELQKASHGVMIHQEKGKQMGEHWSAAKGHTGPDSATHTCG